MKIYCDYPGGNGKVLDIDEARGIVQLAPDMRDSTGRWFHWDVTVSGAAGRTLHFQFPDGYEYLSTLGPAISRDGGATWSWLRPDGTRHEPANAFDYTFGPDENQTRFAMSFPYSQRNWDAFTARWRARPDVVFGVLCKSQNGTRDTELLRLPCRGDAKWLVVFTARHHACETTANSAMEGVLEELLSDSPEAEWMRAEAECVFVPFMDKDGVEDGDQGKNRIPHDHNRDYLAGHYTSVRALKALVEEESRERKLIFIDMHSPHVRSLPNGGPEQDQVFMFGSPDPAIDARWNALRRNWAEAQRDGELVYDGSFDIPAGVGYDQQVAKDRENGLVGSRAWALSQPNCYLATSCEFGYSRCGGVFSYAAARELGHSLAKAVVRTAWDRHVPLVNPVSPAVRDAMRGPVLRDVRLGSNPAEKMHAFIAERMLSRHAQRDVFGEARQAFKLRDDDWRGHGGSWRGEFWGKLMLGTARVAQYLENPELTAFVRDECHRLMALQDPDGYLGSYADKTLVAITDPETTKSLYGWCPVWNIWNRKYAMWGMLEAWRATGDESILDSVRRQADQLISMLARLGFRLHETGTYGMNGLPSMSILKPMLILYEVTGETRYLDFARDMLPDWDRDDNAPPNFFRNASKPIPLREWYPEPELWAKSYELMSCLDGLLEYHRVTGDARCLETVFAIRDNLAATELNPLGSVGYGDKLCGGAVRVNALNEVCDAIHWIRLNLDLFLITGEQRCLDAMELAYFNCFLAGVHRSGQWGAFFVRGHNRHQDQRQCGLSYNHCCVNNVPRTFMDMASATVTVDAKGAYHVNLYQDATATLDGVRFEISGNYPVGDTVMVRVSKPVEVAFRHPAWCPKMDVSRDGDVYTLRFDMAPRLIERAIVPGPEDAASEDCWEFRRYTDNAPAGVNDDLRQKYRLTPAATVMWGPLILAKSRRIGATRAELLDDSTIIGKGYSVSLSPLPATDTWGLWDLVLTKPGEPTIRAKVCDYQSAGDDPFAVNADVFSIWF